MYFFLSLLILLLVSVSEVRLAAAILAKSLNVQTDSSRITILSGVFFVYACGSISPSYYYILSSDVQKNASLSLEEMINASSEHLKAEPYTLEEAASALGMSVYRIQCIKSI